LLVGGHEAVVTAYEALLQGGSFEFADGLTRLGLADIGNGLAQLTALASDLPTPSPLPPPTAIPTSTPTPTATPLPAGAPLFIGNWGIVVDRVEIAASLTSSYSGLTEKPAGRFALVFMRITNRGLSPDTFVAYGDIEIKDASGRLSEENFLASSYAQSQYNTDIGANINPDETVHIVAVFDISLSSEYYLLVPGTLAVETYTGVLLPIPP
jgi:hypothetical protein